MKSPTSKVATSSGTRQQGKPRKENQAVALHGSSSRCPMWPSEKGNNSEGTFSINDFAWYRLSQLMRGKEVLLPDAMPLSITEQGVSLRHASAASHASTYLPFSSEPSEVVHIVSATSKVTTVRLHAVLRFALAQKLPFPEERPAWSQHQLWDWQGYHLTSACNAQICFGTETAVSRRNQQGLNTRSCDQQGCHFASPCTQKKKNCFSSGTAERARLGLQLLILDTKKGHEDVLGSCRSPLMHVRKDL